MGKGHILVPLERIENIEENGGGGAKDVAIPLLLNDWVLNETDDTYYQVISIEGLAETSNPLIMLSPADGEASDEELESYACIADMVVSADAIKFIASEKPAISFTVIAKNVIAAKNDAAIADMTNLVSRVSDIEQELKDVAVALLVDNWVLDEETGKYSQSVDIEGLSGDAAPIICAAADSELDYFICISETIVEDNKITFIADELPEASFTAIVKGATVNEVDQVADLTEIVGRLRELEQSVPVVLWENQTPLSGINVGYGLTLPDNWRDEYEYIEVNFKSRTVEATFTHSTGKLRTKDLRFIQLISIDAGRIKVREMSVVDNKVLTTLVAIFNSYAASTEAPTHCIPLNVIGYR